MEALVAKFKKTGTVQLLQKIEKASGSEREAIIQVLQLRGQDVSKWEAGAKLVEKTDSSVSIEIEPEEGLTAAEEKLIQKAEKEDKKTSNLFAEAEKSYKAIVKDNKSEVYNKHESFKKLETVLSGRPFDKKLTQFDLKQIIAIALPPVKGEKAKTEKAPKVKKEKTEKVPKEKKEGSSEGSLEKYVKQFSEKIMTEAEIVALKTKREKVIACWFSGIRDVKEISRIADYAKGNVRGIIHLSDLK